ncbi:hypothetical protein JQ596_34945 [Bradyrhizobium manausense]|uniref:DUF6647 family protein n=1 Tax=Bradyrhizobium TaxID=374 RepID=UPI001BAA00F9|nr:MULTISPECIES: DUF6647 family protein [Bradyrhizobium]MBR0830718.1 hypothetical protein [Bradyrhizobium manausense]UVO31096.1 hypothetical protein KUF59_10830 [Bradyrhizobium arachidis]
MFKQFLAIAAVAASILPTGYEAHCRDLEASFSARPISLAQESDARRRAADLLDEIVAWLSQNFDLPAIKEHPAIELASNMRLAMMRATDGVPSQNPAGNNLLNGLSQRQVVALYDNKSKTILLSEDWTGTSPADQSVLVHEMVHHLQNVAGLKFECPRAREKMAYLAQAKWLERFDLSLEHEFDVDMFTVVISSACIY